MFATAADSSTVHDIEMEPLAVPGHRRRRSSLMNGANGARSSRPRAHSLRNAAGGPGQDEPKISEEDADTDVGSRSPARDDRSGTGSDSDSDLRDDEETGLADRDRRRKRSKKLRNTRLDQRVAKSRTHEPITDEERRLADKDVMRRLTVNGLLILLWYLFSLSISLVSCRPGSLDRPTEPGQPVADFLCLWLRQYNKWMFDGDHLNFKFPLFTTSMHMLVQFALASLVLYLIPSLRPQGRHTSDLGRSRHESEPERSLMTKMFYLTRIGPCGAATGLDIGLGNTSLQFITLTFYSEFPCDCPNSLLGRI